MSSREMNNASWLIQELMHILCFFNWNIEISFRIFDEKLSLDSPALFVPRSFRPNQRRHEIFCRKAERTSDVKRHSVLEEFRPKSIGKAELCDWPAAVDATRVSLQAKCVVQPCTEGLWSKINTRCDISVRILPGSFMS